MIHVKQVLMLVGQICQQKRVVTLSFQIWYIHVSLHGQWIKFIYFMTKLSAVTKSTSDTCYSSDDTWSTCDDADTDASSDRTSLSSETRGSSGLLNKESDSFDDLGSNTGLSDINVENCSSHYETVCIIIMFVL